MYVYVYVDITINNAFLFVLQINMKAGDIPSSVESIAISGARKVVIQPSTIYGLPHLRSFAIDNSGTLYVQGDGLKTKEARLLSLRITSVSNVVTDGLAVQGRWENTSTITIQNITNLLLAAKSFRPQSTSTGPIVELSDISNLYMLGEGVFQGPLSLLSVTRVGSTIQQCSEETFGDRIRHLRLDRLTITDVKRGCFQGSGALARLSIFSCDLVNVHARAFTGEIDEVQIAFSLTRQVFEHSFDINVSRLSIKYSTFDRLALGSLSIAAQDSITLDRVRIGRLERGALTGLRTAEDAGGLAALTVSGLRVSVAQPGSLAFDASVSVCLSELRIGDRRRPCPVEPLVRWLVGGDDGRPLSAAQLQVHRQLRRPAVCAADRRPPASDGSPEPDCDTDLTTAAGPYPAVVAILTLLSASLLAALVILLVRGRGRRLCTSCIPLPRRFAARARELQLGLRALTGSHSGTGANARVVTAAPPDILSGDSLYTSIPPPNTTGESQGAAAAAVSGGLPPSCAGLYAEVGGKDLLPSPGTDDRSGPSLTGNDAEPPALPPVTMKRLQVPGGGQEAGYQQADSQDVGYQEVGYYSADNL